MSSLANFGKKPPTKSDVREAIAESKQIDDALEKQSVGALPVESEELRISGFEKLEKLIDDDFPFDESQLAAIEGLIESDVGCLTGAAGTGKTTVTKKLVDRLMESSQIAAVDMTNYWRSSSEEALDKDDEYESVNDVLPSILMCAYTGRATQQTKKNFPRSWHGNIMTIHRALGFYPEFYEEWDDESQDAVRKMRFVPTYTSELKMPWDIIIIDEAGMLGLDLWNQLYDAMKPNCKLYMIGDINQLPPTHGRPIFGYAMTKWPAFELTHVHRQKGTDNPIVENAWRVIHGQKPVSEGRFQMIELSGDHQHSSKMVRAMSKKLSDMGIYEPNRDSVITPINGELGSRGFALGQLALNEAFAHIFNDESKHPRFMIDGGRERKQFAVGDKVMATKNDWQTGVTNGMTGIISEIFENEGYGGDSMRYGPIKEVNERMKSGMIADDSDMVEVDFDSLNEAFQSASAESAKRKKEKRERGPASHTVVVRFGEGDAAFEIPFTSLAEVGSLQTAYVVTCHKMQGGEAPTIIIILHPSHNHMLYREWLYTAITRASERCILLYQTGALMTALTKQKIKGMNLYQKVVSFNQSVEAIGGLSDVRLPEYTGSRPTLLDRKDEVYATPAKFTTEEEMKGGVAALIRKSKAKQKVEPKPESKTEVHLHINKVEVVHRHEEAKPDDNVSAESNEAGSSKNPIRIKVPPALVASKPEYECVSTRGAYETLLSHQRLRELKLLPKPKPKLSGLAALAARKSS